MAVTAESLPKSGSHAEEHEDPRQHLMFDPRPRGEMNAMVMDAMRISGWKFWVAKFGLSRFVKK